MKVYFSNVMGRLTEIDLQLTALALIADSNKRIEGAKL